MNIRTDTHDSYAFSNVNAAFPWRPKMNASANELHTTQREPIRLDDLAIDHYSRLIHLRDLLTHLEEISIEPPSAGGDYEAARAAMLYSALALAREATEEADRFNVGCHEFNICLMAMPAELLPDEADSRNTPEADEPWQQAQAAMRIATGDAVTVEELTHALETVHALASEDASFNYDLETLTRLIELRGYTVGWLSVMGRDNPRVTRTRPPECAENSTPDPVDIRACLTVEEIETVALTFSSLLKLFLVDVLSHPAKEVEHEPA